MLKSEFTIDGRVEFSEVARKRQDFTRLQSAMFMDRPDLWKRPAKKNHKQVATEQQDLF